MKKAQVNRIVKGIKIAVYVLNLREDKLFTEDAEELKAIDKKIKAATKKALSDYLTKVGYDTTIVDESVLGLNLQAENIEKIIYTRNESIILDSIDIKDIG